MGLIDKGARVFVVGVEVVVEVPGMPGAIRQPPYAVMGSANSPPAFNAAVDWRPAGINIRQGRRDRGRRVVVAGVNRVGDVTGVGAFRRRLARRVVDCKVLVYLKHHF